MRTLALILFLLAPGLSAQDPVQVFRDAYGVAFIESTSDAGAYYGAGYVAAEDRLLHMEMMRRTYRGELAEYFATTQPDAEALAIHDRRMRIFGWRRHAEKVAAAIANEEIGSLLQAYCDGVNDGQAAYAGNGFTTWGITWQPWSVADCIGVWAYLSRLFGSFGETEVQALKDLQAAASGSFAERLQAVYGYAVCHDEAAVVQQTDVDPATLTAMQNYANSKGIVQHSATGLGTYVAKFSQAMAVDQGATGLGRPMVLGQPRVGVTYPNALYEWHMKGETFDVGGAGIPGNPNLLSGYSDQVAWSPTAASVDTADIFGIDVSGVPAGSYRITINGQVEVRPFEVDEQETIQVKSPFVVSANIVDLTYRETVWGQVVTEYVNEGSITMPGVWSVRAVPFTRPEHTAAIGFLDMYRAQSRAGFLAATEGWHFPSANLLFGHSTEGIGYVLVGDIPIRAPNVEFAEAIAMDGSDWDANKWQEYLPHALRPHKLPTAGSGDVVYSGNHLPIGSWYPMKALIRGAGHNPRSLRLAEVAAQPGPFDFPRMTAIQSDTVLEFSSQFVELAEAVRSGLDPSVQADLDLLIAWRNSGARRDLTHEGVVLAIYIPQAMRQTIGGLPVPVSVLRDYGVGTGGMMLFVTELLRGLALPTPRLPTADEYLTLNHCLQAARASYDLVNPSQPWDQWFQAKELGMTLGYLQPYGGFPLEPMVTVSAVFGSGTGNTLLQPRFNSYTQIIAAGDPVGRASLLAIGQADHGAHETDQVPLWEAGGLKRAKHPGGSPAYVLTY